ncbi:hypothetical protein AXG93_4368s1340 [Marchantia polymorpha subsp. ruderalis]|uniref:Bifunctional inhibitor/plant lipid transfer protein/seed storage helical domain-containing protein n=1 Tax=Marchantia polymorpha subsp. ruderalis TaxID=1480154 RepID=A0A176VXY6_MARPO|nr:hypothetical protein AXG93_4368s1340 [Marchantia polymorpha subsp. ruderalis]
MDPNMKLREVITAAILMALLIITSSSGVKGNFSNGYYSESRAAAEVQREGHADMQAAACGRSAAELLPCVTAVSGTGSKPSPSCCAVLIKWGFGCLCDLLNENQGRIPGNINTTVVIELPKACGIQISGGKNCGGLFPQPPAKNSIAAKEANIAELVTVDHE